MIDAVTAATSAASQSGQRATLADNFEMFLVLLTQQLKNQDPLSPLDSNQFVSQLVEFSSVEQLIAQNEALETLVNLEVANIGGATVGYLGKEIAFDSATTGLGPDGARWSYDVAGDSQTVSIAVVDAAGRVVFGAQGELGEGPHEFSWNGLDSTGKPVPPGTYTLEIGAANAEGDPIPVDITSFGLVTGVDLSGSEPVLLISGARAPFSTIFSVQEPQSPAPAPEQQPQS